MSSAQKAFHCPLCHKILNAKGILALCPDGHGALLKGRYIRGGHVEENTTDTAGAPSTDHPLTCPACSHSMQKVNYNNTSIIIDSCTHCSYRWMDRGELTKINTFKGSIDPKGLLILQSIEERLASPDTIKEIKRYTSTEFFQMKIAADPLRLPFHLKDSTRVITSLGLWGIIQSVLHSKTTRILLVVIFVIFISLGVYMVLSAESMKNTQQVTIPATR